MGFASRNFLFYVCCLLVHAEVNPLRAGRDPFCYLRRFEDRNGHKKFFFSAGCDMEPLAKPYSNFPPSLFIIGAQKGGTTELWRQLKFNTVLAANYVKEEYFLLERPEDFKSKYQSKHYAYLNYSNQMSNLTGPSMDGSAGYSKIGGLFIENLKWTTDFKLEEMPKMVFLLRDPLIRLYSAFKMKLKWMNGGNIPPNVHFIPRLTTLQEFLMVEMNKISSCGFNVFLNDTDIDPRAVNSRELLTCIHEPIRTSLLLQGWYSLQLEDIRRVGNPNRILVGCYRDFLADNTGFLNSIAKFVGVTVEGDVRVKAGYEIARECPMAYRKKYNLTVSPEYEALLHSLYKKWNEVLIEDFGIDCGWNLNLAC